jgi:glucokinase
LFELPIHKAAVSKKDDRGAREAGMPWLVADIGGTNARFGWIDGATQGVQRVDKLPVADHAGPAQAVRAYLARLKHELGASYRPPQRAAFAMATAIDGDAIAFTNSHWSFSHHALQVELGLQTLLILNDFEALALSLPRLGAAQLRAHRELPARRGTLAVLGPGTGLGVAAVVQTRHGWVAVSGEGGHATVAPVDDFESELLRHVRTEFSHVSGERLLSGIGLPVLHRGVAGAMGVKVEAASAEAIVERGLAKADPICDRTLDVFCALLGGFAGNVALTTGARGGLYIGGGIVPRLGDRFFASAFRERFEAKGRFRAYLEAIPTAVITDTLAALSGAAQAIAQHEA